MVSPVLNYKHLYYFWVVANEGGISRAAERLEMAPQTISSQVKRLERAVGRSLLAPEGRGLVLTEAGRVALGYAEQIFALGEQMTEALAEGELDRSMRLTVGISDVLPKLVAYDLLEPVVSGSDRIRLVCHEGEFEDLLGDRALHTVAVVRAARPVGHGSGLRVFNHPLGDWDIGVFATATLAERHAAGFPKSLDGAPFLLPTRHTALRARLDVWFETQGIRPRVVGEFEDSALLTTFGGTGMGLFPAATMLAPELAEQFGARLLGEFAQVREQFYAISNERRIRHPAVEILLQASRRRAPVSRPAPPPAPR
ncbi:MAG: LysR family transcriptional regulator [Burkholderiales bacterium]|nr:MAG: LysR family transcriptional regulator [Burkholderiales bacterium]